MNMWLLLGQGLSLAVFIGGIVLCVRFDQQGKTRRRELEHIERMRTIELGRPLNDEAVARYQALGAIGVAVPIASLSSAAICSSFAMGFIERPELQFSAVAVVWLVCGLVCLAILPVISARLRESPTMVHHDVDPANPSDRRDE